MERDKFLTEDEKRVFEKFALTLDAALAMKLDGDLTALKVCEVLILTFKLKVYSSELLTLFQYLPLSFPSAQIIVSK